MKLKLYTIASLILIITLALYAYINFGDEIINHKIITFELALPLYLWIIVPAVVIFVLSLLHMIFYGLKLKFELSRWHKDSLNLQDTLNALLIGKVKIFNIKNKELREIAQALENSKIVINGDLSLIDKNSKLFQNLQTNQTIHNGGYVELPKSNYNKENPLIQTNNLNRLNSDSDFAKQVVKNKENYSKVVLDKAISLYAQTMPSKEIQSYKDLLNKKAILALIQRIKSNDLEATTEIVEILYAKSDKDLVFKLINVIKIQLSPDITLSIFKTLFENDLSAKEYYIYLLLEFEMNEQAREILMEEENFDNYKAYLDLLESGKRYPISLFV